MIKKLGALVLGAVAAIALLPASANAAPAAGGYHNAGGYQSSCFYRDSSAYAGVLVTVDGLGSDSPRNALIAAAGRVSAPTSCKSAGRVRIVRVQIDTLRLLHGSTVYKTVGPVNNNSSNVYAQTAGKNDFPCSWNLRVYIHFSARYTDGSLGAGDTYGPYFRRC